MKTLPSKARSKPRPSTAKITNQEMNSVMVAVELRVQDLWKLRHCRNAVDRAFYRHLISTLVCALRKMQVVYHPEWRLANA